MAHLSDRVNVGIGVMVYNHRGEVLLGQRISDKHGKGEFSFPGGKPDPYESPVQGATRELLEETGLLIPTTAMHKLPFWTYDRYPDWEVHFVTVYFSCHMPITQNPVNMEPEKCAGWRWYRPDRPPTPLFSGAYEALLHGPRPRPRG